MSSLLLCEDEAVHLPTSKMLRKVILASDSLHVVSGMPMSECAISFHAENRIMRFSGTDISLKNDNIRGCGREGGREELSCGTTSESIGSFLYKTSSSPSITVTD